ncbi:LuxR C-terminal-related transcriptional regulator [Streptomyces sp. NPDC051976]|uniref:helix-turn-helix transcriptional regulator n=1 Tax=Streptomyces sp. NPDC051976 TaxID=3154947 RepID=UPI00343CECAF
MPEQVLGRPDSPAPGEALLHSEDRDGGIHGSEAAYGAPQPPPALFAGRGAPQHVRAAAARGEASADIDAAILGELAGLDPTALSVVRTAAVLGEQFHPELVAAVAGLKVPETVTALDALVRVDLVRPTGPARQFALRRPRVAEVVYEQLEPNQRAAVHLRAEAVLAQRAAPITQRAHHVARAADPNRPDHVTTLIAAARDTLHSVPVVAADYLEAALSLLHPGHAHWHEAQVLLARARLLTGNVFESRALLQALRPGQPLLDPSAVADASRIERVLGRYAEAAAIARSGLAALPDHDTAVAAALHTELADAALDQQRYEEARQHADMAATIARGHGDSAGEANALAQASLANLFTAGQAMETMATRAAELVDAATDATVLTNLQSVYQLGLTEATLDRLTDAERHLTRGAVLSRGSGQTYILATILKALANVQLSSGHLHRALVTLDEAGHHAERAGSPATRAITMALRASVLLWQGSQGDVSEVLTLAERAADIASGPPTAWAITVRCFHAEIVLLTGDPAHSRWLLLDAVGGTDLPLLTTWRKPRWCDTVAQVALMSGDEQLVEQSATLAEDCVEQLPSHGRRGFALRARMRAHLLHGEAERAVQSAQQAIKDFSASGKRIETCRTLLDVAALSLDAGRTRDVDSWLGHAAHLADACGSARLTGEVAFERSRLTATMGWERVNDGLATLSAREREIADLTSTGMTNREIAAALFLSVRTVDAHLGRIYRKLGVPNRAGLTRSVLKSGGPTSTGQRISRNR